MLSLCYVEVACDVVCRDAYCVERIAQGFLSSFLQPHQRDKESWAYVDYAGCVTGFTTRKNPRRNERRQGFWFQWYIDKPCRKTGDPYCFHFEGKHEGRQAVKRIGIFHPRDLERFDFVAYFTKYASKLYHTDFERLGRWESIRNNGRKRKKSVTSPSGYNRDLGMGQAIYRIQSLHPKRGHRSLHVFVDRCGRGPFLKPYSIMFMVTNDPTSSSTKSDSRHREKLDNSKSSKKTR
jgi:hypothetical protein